MPIQGILPRNCPPHLSGQETVSPRRCSRELRATAFTPQSSSGSFDSALEIVVQETVSRRSAQDDRRQEFNEMVAASNGRLLLVAAGRSASFVDKSSDDGDVGDHARSRRSAILPFANCQSLAYISYGETYERSRRRRQLQNRSGQVLP